VSPPEVSRITVPDAVLHQQLGEETVLLHLATERYYGLDEVGSRVWQLLQEHRTLDPIVGALLDEYDVDETTLRGDLERLLDELADLGLVHVERA
jgi:Coenzyme PQQ synthesis protein D (PqqD)